MSSNSVVHFLKALVNRAQDVARGLIFLSYKMGRFLRCFIKYLDQSTKSNVGTSKNKTRLRLKVNQILQLPY